MIKLTVVLPFLLFISASFAVCDKNAEKLIKAYPDRLLKCEDNIIIWTDGYRQIYDDGKEKTFEQLIASPDIQDMFAYRYPVGEYGFLPPKINEDPGRIRNALFFKRMYGQTKSQIQKHLVLLDWMPKSTQRKVRISTVNQIDEKLQNISNALDALPQHLKKYVIKHSGAFNWRYISGTKRLSPHSFGIAIDINSKYANYWKWQGRADNYQNSIPYEIIAIFEANGFIWGGKWYHYDTMHFEYRPELLIQ